LWALGFWQTSEVDNKQAQSYVKQIRGEQLQELREQGAVLRKLIAAQGDDSFACSARSRKESATDEMRATIAEVLQRMRL
jgi:ribosomal protein L12E/L44/L45/RPP1/RPP2